METTNNTLREVTKFIVPGLLVVAGLLTLIISGGQNDLFLLGGIGLTLVGLLSVIYTMGWIDKRIRLIVAIVLILGAGFYAFQSYRSVAKVIEFNEAVAKRLEVMEPAFFDIRDAQQTFEKRYGRYTKSFDTLTNFLKGDSVMEVYREGIKPTPTPATAELLGIPLYDLTMAGGFTDAQALALDSLSPDVTFKRDTFYTPAVDYWNSLADSARLAERKLPESINRLPYVPYEENLMFIMDAGMIDRGNNRVPVFVVKDPAPMGRKTWQIGSMEEPTFSGNW